MKRPARLALAATLTLALAACGSDDGGDDPTVAAPSESASASASASPEGEQTCPITTTEAPAPAGSTTDLAVKPVVAPNAAPAPEGIVVSDIVEGTGEEVGVGDEMALKYVGALYASGEEFDSSWSRDPNSTLDLNGVLPKACFEGVVPGFSVGPIGMKVGGRRQITFPAQFGYGEQGNPPTIPGGAALVFVVDLVSIGAPPA